MTGADARTLADVLRRPWRTLLAAGWGGALLLLAVVLTTAALRGPGNAEARAAAAILDLDAPVTAPSGSLARHPGAARPGVRPDPVPAAPGVFHPSAGARP